jgi:Protein of unknown function (DUF732)
MKKVIAAAGLGAALLLTGAGTASADSDETYFLDLQVSHGWQIWDPSAHVAMARYACSKLQYTNGYAVADELYWANGPWTRSASQVFVQDAATALCPWTWAGGSRPTLQRAI